MRRLSAKLALFALIIIPVSTLGDDSGVLGFGSSVLRQPISTDRPDFTETADSVEPGHLQFETGYTFVYDDSHPEQSLAHVVPEVLMRAGVTDRFELRLVWLGYIYERENGESVEGGDDLGIGFKQRITDQEGYQPQLSLIASAKLPSGADSIRSSDVVPELKLLWAYDLGEPWGVAGNINFTSPVRETDRFFEHAVSIAVARDLGEDFGFYGEFFGIYAKDGNQRARNFIDGGFTYLATPAVQFDIRIGFGLNSSAEDMFTGVGMSWCL